MGDDDQIPQSEAFQRQLLGREWGIERVLEDGDEIDLGGDVRLHVLHTPGHTPGRLRSTGRVRAWSSAAMPSGVEARGPAAFRSYFSSPDYASSLRRLLDLNAATLAQAHRYRWSAPTQEAVRTGPEVRQTLEESLAVWQAIDTAVRSKACPGSRRRLPRARQARGASHGCRSRQRPRGRAGTDGYGEYGRRALARGPTPDSQRRPARPRHGGRKSSRRLRYSIVSALKAPTWSARYEEVSAPLPVGGGQSAGVRDRDERVGLAMNNQQRDASRGQARDTVDGPNRVQVDAGQEPAAMTAPGVITSASPL